MGFYVSKLLALAIEAFKWYANENPEYINTISDLSYQVTESGASLPCRTTERRYCIFQITKYVHFPPGCENLELFTPHPTPHHPFERCAFLVLYNSVAAVFYDFVHVMLYTYLKVCTAFH